MATIRDGMGHRLHGLYTSAARPSYLGRDAAAQARAYSRKNCLYQAFQELGRVVRTAFLLRFLHDTELRRVIQAATNKSESFNRFVQWLFFGGEDLIAENDRDQQRKGSRLTPRRRFRPA
jgi:TnpA family transposase